MAKPQAVRHASSESGTAALAAAPSINIVGIMGYGTARNSTGQFLAARGPSSFPLNNLGTVLINGVYDAGTYPQDYFFLTQDGASYQQVFAGGGGASVALDGYAISNNGTLTYQRGPMFSGTPNFHQLFRLPTPYSTTTSIADACPCYAGNIYTNSSGAGVGIFSDTTTNAPTVVSFGGAQVAWTPLNLGLGKSIRGEKTKILENGAIYVSVLNGTLNREEILRFPPGDTENPSVAYALAVGTAIHAWDVDEGGRLVVAETTDGTGGRSAVSQIETNGAKSLVLGTESDNQMFSRVFINQSGVVAGIRAFYTGPDTGKGELVYATPGNPIARVLGTGDSLNGGIIINVGGTSEMNESGQLTVFSQLTVPEANPTRAIVYRVDPTFPPSITALSPSSGSVGSSVTITGTSLTGATSVAFNGTEATFSVISPTRIDATVPSGATTGTVAVTTPAGSATSVDSFTVVGGVNPTIGSFSPLSAGVGTAVTIFGTNLFGVTEIRFNGVLAKVGKAMKGGQGTQITAVVPLGATSGKITVTTTSGTAVSPNDFIVLPPPTLTGFSPEAGPVGTVVNISGTDFTGVSSVMFNNSKAAFTVYSSNSLSAVVPKGGKSGPITVVTAGGSGTSAASFTVTK
jgi:hypothetical protein